MGSEVRRRIEAANAEEQAKEQKETKKSVKERRELNILINSMAGVLLCMTIGLFVGDSIVTGKWIPGELRLGIGFFAFMAIVFFYGAYKAYRGKKK